MKTVWVFGNLPKGICKAEFIYQEIIIIKISIKNILFSNKKPAI